MSKDSRWPAVLAYLIPVISWLYVYFFQRKNDLAVFHLKQAIGLFLFLIFTVLGWMVIGWVLAWFPYMMAVSMALFGLVIVAYLYGFVAWITGMIRAFRKQFIPLPVFGRWANRLPL